MTLKSVQSNLEDSHRGTFKASFELCEPLTPCVNFLLPWFNSWLNSVIRHPYTLNREGGADFVEELTNMRLVNLERKINCLLMICRIIYLFNQSVAASLPAGGAVGVSCNMSDSC